MKTLYSLALPSLLFFLITGNVPLSKAEEGVADLLIDRLISAPTEKEWRSLLPEFRNQGVITGVLLFRRLQAFIKASGSLNSPSGKDLSRRIFSALMAMGLTGQRIVISRLRDQEELPEVRVFAGEVLVRTYPQQSIPILLEVLSRSFSSSQSSFLSPSLLLAAELKDHRFLSLFSKALGHPIPSVRWSAATALGFLGKRGIPSLIQALGDKDLAVQTAVDRALRKITGKDAGFFPLADPLDREKAVQRWKQWWREGGKGSPLPPPTFKEIQRLLEALLLWVTRQNPLWEEKIPHSLPSRPSSPIQRKTLYVAQNSLPKGLIPSVPGFKVCLLPRAYLSERTRKGEASYCDFMDFRVSPTYAEVTFLWSTSLHRERRKLFLKKNEQGTWTVVEVLSVQPGF